MLDVGFSEILLTSAIALIVLGPERLPKVARQVGNWMGRARAMARQLSEQLEREVSAEELLKIQSKPALPPDPPYNAPNPPPNALMAPNTAALAPGAATQYEATPQITATAPGVATPVADQTVQVTGPACLWIGCLADDAGCHACLGSAADGSARRDDRYQTAP
jgi:Tat protein translocase TatB subunit